jgi:tRNA A-37 threonylcarbamoyl transferase component Bud32
MSTLYIDSSPRHSFRLASGQVFNISHGNLNSVEVLEDDDGNLACLRQSKNDNREVIKKYLANLYSVMGLGHYNGQIRYLTVHEQVRKMQRLQQKGIKVPSVIDYGDTWMLMTFEEGTPLEKILQNSNEEQTHTVVEIFLENLLKAHMCEECIWDRWGGNELISNVGITFIDFDIDVSFPDHVSKKIQSSFDLAVALRGCIQTAAHKVTSTKTIKRFLEENQAAIASIYDLSSLSLFLEGQMKFYDEMYCEGRQGFYTNIYSTHAATNSHIAEIKNKVRSFISPTKTYHYDFM